jgi:predicted unusual protein kinase regulating ubiquinone biosynthesis (AarF/ABC1/UbiB family)
MLRSRYRRITFFFARLLLGLAYWEVLLPRLGLRSVSQRTRSDRLRKSAVRMRSLAIEMGGVMIKIGQFLSTRVDILPPEFTMELEGLQDEVPAEKFSDLKQVAEAEFGVPLDKIFAEIEDTPMAAASIGQAHIAWLQKPSTAPEIRVDPSNLEDFDPDTVVENELIQVVVKIQRPNIEEIVKTDLAALQRVGRWLSWYEPIRRRADIPTLLDDFSSTLFEEMDYIHEGKNAELFAQNFADEPRVRVPRVAWAFTTKRVITLEDVSGIKITDYDKISAMGINRVEVANLLFQTYLQQIFSDFFFHADPHPGNLFVLPGEETGSMGREWQLVYIDFGMMGQLSERQRAGLREMAIAITTQDAARAVKAYDMLGFLLPNADLTLIEQAGTEVLDRFWGKSTQELREIEIQEVIEFTREYRNLMYDLPFQVPSDLILLGRAISILSGMCAGLDPNFNVWLSILPFAQGLISEERQAGWDYWRNELSNLERSLIKLPGRLNNLLMQLERGEIGSRNPELNERVDRVERSVRALTITVVFASLLLSGIYLVTQSYSLFGGILISLSFIALIISLFTRN